MSRFQQSVLNYGEDVKDLDCSPFEHLRMLHDRTELERIIQELDDNEKRMLIMYDLMLLAKTDEVLNHIREVYDFSLSDVNNIPYKQWWWHLDKISEQRLHIQADLTTSGYMVTRTE